MSRGERILQAPTSRAGQLRRTITKLPDTKYELIRPIPVYVDRIEEKEFVACFEKAGLAMSAETPDKALAELSEHLLDVLESFSENEAELGPLPAAQLSALRQFIREKAARG